MSATPPNISTAVPVYNSDASLPELKACRKNDMFTQVLLVCSEKCTRMKIFGLEKTTPEMTNQSI